jgi:hypothetical protein
MASTRRIYILLKLYPWDGVKAGAFGVNDPAGSLGMALIFDSMEALAVFDPESFADGKYLTAEAEWPPS